MSSEPISWLDVDRIGEELQLTHPQMKPAEVSFPTLRALVEALPGFMQQPGHPCNERILEAIQQSWIDEHD